MMKKNVLRYLFALGIIVSFAQCADDEILDKYVPAMSGDEVMFGASASFLDGNHPTRTSYGDPTVETGEGTIPLNWSPADKIDIVCNQCLPDRNQGVYEVVDAADNSRLANQLKRVSEVGLQWNGNGPHQFYAIYPSKKMFSGAEQGKGLLFAPGALRGYMPQERTVKATSSDQKNWTVAPDMRYAFMFAENKTTLDEANAAGGVSLQFHPLVTALQFHLKGGSITAPAGSNNYIVIKSVQLESRSGQNLAGTFIYDPVTQQYNLEESSSRIVLTIDNPTTSPCRFTEGSTLDVTFFALPSTQLEAGDLNLIIEFQHDGTTFIHKARVNTAIAPQTKYEFKNVKMKPITAATLTTSNWFSAVDDQAYISQLSIPVASHAFSYYYQGDHVPYHKEQVLDYQTLWNKGIRGFELRTSYKGNSLKGAKFVCAGQEVSGNNTFGSVFENLYQQLQANPTETLVLVCTYQSYGGDGNGYRPQGYLDALTKYLDDFSKKKKKQDIFVKLGTGSTAGDIRGKIAIVIRLADYDYVRLDGTVTPESLKLNGDWANYLAYVNDWGTSIDNWDIRYGSEYYRQGAYKPEKGGNKNKKVLEDNLIFRVGSSSTSKPGNGTTGSWGDNPNFPTANPLATNYTFSVNGQPDGAMVQCWERVIPNNGLGSFYTGSYVETGFISKTRTYLWCDWPESVGEKKEAIKMVLNSAIATRQNPKDQFFVNSLAGYFPAEDLAGSVVPYAYSSIEIGSKTYSMSQVTGGDYMSCAAELNCFLYDYLSSVTNEQTGPWGLIMLDYIGASATDFNGLKFVSSGVTNQAASDKTKKLVDLIIRNNFKFPLQKAKTTRIGADTDSSMMIENDGDAISF